MSSLPQVSPYGLMIVLGLAAASLVGWRLVKHFHLDANDFFLLVVYGVSAGVVGAKLLFLFQNITRIRWDRILDPDYLRLLIGAGFVFYGGIPLGVGMAFLAGRIHHIRVLPYLKVAVPVIPLAHAFGRVGCALVGCCYGIPWDGPLAITYHTSVAAPADTPLFPVQPLEAVCLLLIAALLLLLCFRGWGGQRLLGMYLAAYGVVRFVLEFFRGDAIRGSFLWFSTSQWVSLLFLPIGLVLILVKFRRRAVSSGETG